ncbi:DNA-protecting protein DprA, partial [Flavobacteriaceae bacterium]|nr:DNA-protecting protein DprA [Flavobacteriaceae bacterium]
KTAVKTVQKSLFVDLSKEETALYDLLKEPLSLDEIALKTQRSVGQVAAELMQMELKGVVRSLAGKRFEQF